MRFVIKIGTSLIADSRHRLDKDFLTGFVKQVAKIKECGHQAVIVSSGAVASGRAKITFKHEKKSIPCKQALAAVGQGVLMKIYNEMFEKYGITVAQALLTNYDFTNRDNFINTKNVLDLLLQQGVVPVINENDVTTIAELKFGDNDMLSAKVAAMVSANCLVILTDVDGLFDSNPTSNPSAKLIRTVEKIDDKVKAYAQGPKSEHSRGGMITKIAAAQYATQEGTNVFIANGKKEGSLSEVVSFFEKRSKNQTATQPVSTFFAAKTTCVIASKKWLKPQILPNAFLEIDAGALKAICKKGKSLLPSGITKVSGKFDREDVVLVKNNGKEIAYGQVNYSSSDIDKIKGCGSDKIGDALGYSFEEEIMHRDKMVIID